MLLHIEGTVLLHIGGTVLVHMEGGGNVSTHGGGGGGTVLFHMGHENIAIPHVRVRGRDGERGREGKR